MRQYNYKVRDIKNFILESTNEFKPIMGHNVENDNKKNNEKAYKDALNRTSKYDAEKAKSTETHEIPFDDNKGMQDLEYDNLHPSQTCDFKKRVKSQLKGYTSAENERLHSNDEFGNAYHTEIKGMDKKQKEFKDKSNISKEIGLTSRELVHKDFNNLASSVFENKILKLKFKNTTFLTENQMVSKIPDDFKKDGKKFYVSDKQGTTYLVEWNDTPKIVNLTETANEALKITQLINYQPQNNNTTNTSRLFEDNKFNDMINKARKMMK